MYNTCGVALANLEALGMLSLIQRNQDLSVPVFFSTWLSQTAYFPMPEFLNVDIVFSSLSFQHKAITEG